MLIKRGQLIFLIVFVGIVIAFGAFFFLRTVADDGHVGGDYADIRESELEDIAGPKKSFGGSSGGGSGGGGSSGGGSGVFGAGAVVSESPPEEGEDGGECNQISFLTSNHHLTQNCNLFDQDVCVSKTATCSVDVGNLDDDVSGIFGVSFVFYEEGGQVSSPIHSALVENDIFPGDTITFTQEILIESQGAEGDANKNMACSYSVVEVPKKIC